MLSIAGMQIGTSALSVLADLQVAFQKTIPANTTNGEIDLVLTLAQVAVMGIEADQACTIKVNSTSPAPQDTFALAAAVPLIWTSGDPASASFLVSNVTKLYVTTGAQATILKFVAGVDATPGLSG